VRDEIGLTAYPFDFLAAGVDFGEIDGYAVFRLEQHVRFAEGEVRAGVWVEIGGVLRRDVLHDRTTVVELLS